MTVEGAQYRPAARDLHLLARGVAEGHAAIAAHIAETVAAQAAAHAVKQGRAVTESVTQPPAALGAGDGTPHPYRG